MKINKILCLYSNKYKTIYLYILLLIILYHYNATQPNFLKTSMSTDWENIKPYKNIKESDTNGVLEEEAGSTYLLLWAGLWTLLKSPVELQRLLSERLLACVEVGVGGVLAVGRVGEGEGEVGTGDTLLELGESECSEPVDW